MLEVDEQLLQKVLIPYVPPLTYLNFYHSSGDDLIPHAFLYQGIGELCNHPYSITYTSELNMYDLLHRQHHSLDFPEP